MKVGNTWINGAFIIAGLVGIAIWVWIAVGVKTVIVNHKPSPVARMK